MNLLDQQQAAKRASRWLIPLFLLAILVLVAIINAVVLFIEFWLTPAPYTGLSSLVDSYLAGSGWLIVTGMILLIIFSGSIRRARQLGAKGMFLPDFLGADSLNTKASNKAEKQYMNIAEEMAIAAAIPVPRLYVMREQPAINAFVTGVVPQQALVVTQGALDHLDRDELQGIIAHEFSHLLNGDTRLNQRMLILLAGLLAVGQLGKYFLDKAIPDHRIHSLKKHGNDHFVGSPNNDFTSLLVFPAVALIIAGYAGLFLGRLVKAAIKRQRESLADASACQFTRHPAGLANALIKISNGPGTYLTHQNAEDINHMCFADTVRIRLHALLATHPTTKQRLHAIDPAWVARARVRRRKQQTPSTPHFTPEHLGYAQSLIETMPSNLLLQLHKPDGACLVIYALLMDVSQQRFLPAIDETNRQKLPQLVEQINKLGRRVQLPLVDMALPAIQELDTEGRKQLIQNINWLFQSGIGITLFRFLLHQLVRQRLNPAPASRTRFNWLQQLARPVQLLLSMMIYCATDEETGQKDLFTRHAAPLLPPGRQLLPHERCSLNDLAHALKQIRQLSPFLKKTLLDTCSDIVLADNKIQVEEVELLRLVSLLADSPMPPIIHQPANKQ